MSTRTTIEDESTAPPQITTEPTTLTGDLKTLKEAFPDLDIEIIETILASQGGNLDNAFDMLLRMSDPSYKPTQSETEQLSQLRQDEEYARRLAREGDAHRPQQTTNTNNNNNNQPLFNLQEELPVIKEKVIEAGTAAKNKIVNLYNQFMAGTSNQQQNRNNTGNLLESGIGNLSLSENPQRPVDLYEWDGQPQKKTSTPKSQIVSDEEYARRLAKEDAELAEAIAISANSVNEPPPQVNPPQTPPRPQKESDNEQEVTFSVIEPVEKKKAAEEDDLDDLFDKNDSNIDDILQDIDDDAEEDKDKKK